MNKYDVLYKETTKFIMPCIKNAAKAGIAKAHDDKFKFANCCEQMLETASHAIAITTFYFSDIKDKIFDENGILKEEILAKALKRGMSETEFLKKFNSLYMRSYALALVNISAFFKIRSTDKINEKLEIFDDYFNTKITDQLTAQEYISNFDKEMLTKVDSYILEIYNDYVLPKVTDTNLNNHALNSLMSSVKRQK